MPIYEYQCPSHGVFEVSQRITESALTTCVTPECGQPVKKLISTTAFALKGTGWYATDYKSSSSSSSSSSARSDEKQSASDAGGCGKVECGTSACASVAEA